MRLVDSTSTFAAEVDGQIHTTFVHLSMFGGGAIGDTKLVLWNK